MSSLATRAHLSRSGDYYLSPLSSVQMPRDALENYYWIIGNEKNELEYVKSETTGKSEIIAHGFELLDYKRNRTRANDDAAYT